MEYFSPKRWRVWQLDLLDFRLGAGIFTVSVTAAAVEVGVKHATMKTKTKPTRRELFFYRNNGSSQRQSSARQAAGASSVADKTRNQASPASRPSGSPHEAATSAFTEERERAPRAAGKRTLWPDDARAAARKLHNEKGSWAAAVDPFTKLAKEKGWGSSYTVDSLKAAVANRPTSHRKQWTPVARKAALQLYEAVGSWDSVVEPFNKLAAEKGWGANFSKTSIYVGALKQLREGELRESDDQEPDSVDVTSSRHDKRKKQKTVVGDGDQDQGKELPATRLRLTSSTVPPTQAHQWRPEDNVGGDVDDDPILRFLIREYDRMSSNILDLESATAADLQANVTDVNAPSVLKAKPAQLKVALASEVKTRNNVVARIVVQAKKYGRPGADARCGAFQADIEDAQRTSHAKCAQLGAWIRRKRLVIVGLKKNVHAMLESSDWEDEEQWSDVDQLGAMVAKEQRVVRHLEADRLREFVQLFKFCTEVREAAKKMMAGSAAVAE